MLKYLYQSTMSVNKNYETKKIFSRIQNIYRYLTHQIRIIEKLCFPLPRIIHHVKDYDYQK